MTTVSLKIIVDGQSYDFSDLVRTYESFDRACSEDFRHAVSTRSLTLVYTSQLLSLLSQSNVLVEIDVNGARDFTGRLAPSSLQTRSYGAALSGADIEDLSVEFEDYTYRLERQLTSTDDLVIEDAVVCDASQLGKSCLHRLLNLAGLEVVNPPNIDTALLAFAPDPGQTILDVLDTLLYEYGYTFTFDPYGRVKIIKIIYDNPAPELTLTEHDIKAPLEIEKLYSEYDSVEVSYYPLKYKERVLLYMADLPFGDNGLRSGWPIQPGYLWPEEANVQETWFEYTDKAIGSKLDLRGNVVVNKDFTSIVMTKNHAVEEKTDPGVQKILQQFENKRCRLAYKNNSDYPKNIYYCNIIGDCIYRSSKVFACKNMVSDPCKKNSYESSYIHDGLAANRLCAFKAESLNGKCWKFVFKNDEELIPGTIIRIFDQYSGLDAISIITEKCYNITTNEYAYKSVGIKAPEIASILNTSVIIPEPISSNGIPAINTKTKKITISLYQENSLKPELPSNEINYTISTGQIEGLDNGWSIELQNAVRKPIWMTSYTTIIQLTQDEILISTDKWHEPVKIFVGTPIYLGMVSNIPDSSTFSNNRIEGDWCLCTVNGKFYKWTGTEWTDNNITTDNKMAALQDLLTIADASDTIAFCQTLIAIDVFAQNIAAKRAFIDTLEAQTLNINGTLKSGNQAANNAKVAIQDAYGVTDVAFTGNGTNDLAIANDGTTQGIVTVEITNPLIGDNGVAGGKITALMPVVNETLFTNQYNKKIWNDARNEIESLSEGMKQDWRLPSVNEMQQIVENNASELTGKVYWTNEEIDETYAYAIIKDINAQEIRCKNIQIINKDISVNHFGIYKSKVYDYKIYDIYPTTGLTTIYIYDMLTGTVTQKPINGQNLEIRTFEKINNYLYLVSTYGGLLCIYDLVTDNYVIKQIPIQDPDTYIRASCVLNNKIYMPALSKDKIYIYDISNDTFTYRTLAYNLLNCMTANSYNGKVYIPCSARMIVYDEQSDTFNYYNIPAGEYLRQIIVGNKSYFTSDYYNNKLIIYDLTNNTYIEKVIPYQTGPRYVIGECDGIIYIMEQFYAETDKCYFELYDISTDSFTTIQKIGSWFQEKNTFICNNSIYCTSLHNVYIMYLPISAIPVRTNTETRRFRHKLNNGAWQNRSIIVPYEEYLTNIDIKIYWPQIDNHIVGDKWTITQDAIMAMSIKDINGVEYVKACDGTLEVKTLKVTDETINVTAVYAP